MKKFLVVVLLVFACGHVHSQTRVPGYLGKRHSLSIQYLSGIGLAGGPENLSYRKGLYGWGGGTRELYFTHSVAGAYNYVLSKRYSIGFGVRQGWLGMRSLVFPSPFDRLKTTAAGIHLDMFPFLRRGTIAPLGPYTRFKFYWTYSRSFQVEPVAGSDIPETAGLTGKLMMPFVFMEFGNNFVISDLLTLSPGLSLGGGIPAFVPLDDTNTIQVENMWLRLQSGWGVNLFLEMAILL